MDILVMLFFSWRLHRQASLKKTSPMRWVLSFSTAFLAVMMLFGAVVAPLEGIDPKKDLQESARKMLPYLPLLYVFEITLYLIFRKLISRLPGIDEPTPPPSDPTPPPPAQKDLSYFR